MIPTQKRLVFVFAVIGEIFQSCSHVHTSKNVNVINCDSIEKKNAWKYLGQIDTEIETESPSRLRTIKRKNLWPCQIRHCNNGSAYWFLWGRLSRIYTSLRLIRRSLHDAINDIWSEIWIYIACMRQRWRNQKFMCDEKRTSEWKWLWSAVFSSKESLFIYKWRHDLKIR